MRICYLVVERIHDAITLYGNEYIAYEEPLSAIISNKDELSIAFQTSQQTTFIALIGNNVDAVIGNLRMYFLLAIFSQYRHRMYELKI